MRLRATSAVLTALLVGAAAPAMAAPVPPPAPSPTDSGNSPAAPDPHPPRGGLDPDGHPVGGAAPAQPQGRPAGRGAGPAARPHRPGVDGHRPRHRRRHRRPRPARPLPAGEHPEDPDHGDAAAAAARRAHRGGLDERRRDRGLARRASSPAAATRSTSCSRACCSCRATTAPRRWPRPPAGARRRWPLMNRTALALGAYDTLVQTPSGLDGWQQLTSAYDMTLFLRAALPQPRFARYDNVAQGEAAGAEGRRLRRDVAVQPERAVPDHRPGRAGGQDRLHRRRPAHVRRRDRTQRPPLRRGPAAGPALPRRPVGAGHQAGRLGGVAAARHRAGRHALRPARPREGRRRSPGTRGRRAVERRACTSTSQHAASRSGPWLLDRVPRRGRARRSRGSPPRRSPGADPTRRQSSSRGLVAAHVATAPAIAPAPTSVAPTVAGPHRRRRRAPAPSGSLVASA